ncbi:MAG: hypothetical protein J2P27_18905 [Actinobacteria bacterium]|nr:hypothetical protein [Actinomycetota bacterium]
MHTRNLLADRGQVVLLDFESTAIGPREWDLLPTAIAVDRYGLGEDAYRHFAEAYGFDVRTWSVTVRFLVPSWNAPAQLLRRFI